MDSNLSDVSFVSKELSFKYDSLAVPSPEILDGCKYGQPLWQHTLRQSKAANQEQRISRSSDATELLDF